MRYCQEKYNKSTFQDIRDISALKDMTEDDKAAFGCITKCYYEEVGSYQNGVFDASQFVRSENGTEAEKDQVESCHGEVNSKFNETDRYSCRYFFDLDICVYSIGLEG